MVASRFLEHLDRDQPTLADLLCATRPTVLLTRRRATESITSVDMPAETSGVPWPSYSPRASAVSAPPTSVIVSPSASKNLFERAFARAMRGPTAADDDSSSGDEVPRLSPIGNLRRQFSRKARRASVNAAVRSPDERALYRHGAIVPAALTPSLTPSRDGNDAEDEEDEVRSPEDEIRARPIFDEDNWNRVLKQPSPSPSRRKLDLMLFDPPSVRPRSASVLDTQRQKRPPLTPRHSQPSPIRMEQSELASPDERVQRWLQARTPIAPLRYPNAATHPVIEQGESIYGSVSAASSICPPSPGLRNQSEFDISSQSGETSTASQTGETSTDEAEREDTTPTPKRAAVAWWRAPDGSVDTGLQPILHSRAVSA